ncbi:MAG: ATP-dependent Clp protease ATP-binding subunit [Deltaproteobacteria bacterium]|nr:ATP-dependent Clp protease ATP-binding subunit [Deltaproteobacteria bacterium]
MTSTPAGEPAVEKPRWLRDLVRFLPLKSQFVLSGNIRDLQLAEFPAGSGQAVPLPLVECLCEELRAFGYTSVIAYDPLTGFRVLPRPGQQRDASADTLLTELGLQPADGFAPAGLELFAETLRRIVEREGPRIAVLADFASQMVVRPDALLNEEHRAFTRALILSQRAQPRRAEGASAALFNTVVWIVEKEGDLPDWLLIGNPRVRHVPVSRPDHHFRRPLARSLLRALPGADSAPPEQVAAAVEAFVDETEGMLLVDLNAIVQLARTERIELSRIRDAIRQYKVGVTEDPWARIERSKIRNGESYVKERVKGQDHAVTRVLDIVKRAATGVGGGRRGNRPRGVAFLAGPTGVGKTELAKMLTSLLHGDESAYIRFDMSEFNAEHADQRLLGAPPGYVGYDVGGELTNAVRERPFSVILFDEIEKAHPRLFDKFLQVLDDGVLTSGRGDRVYFSEAFIIFTSNLGVGSVTPAMPFEEVENGIRTGIQSFFRDKLGRPELLNRIGDNIIVFDFIRDDVASEILAGMVRSLFSDVLERQRISVSLSDGAYERLREVCLADMSHGGRGIRNKVESHLVNPLARALFDRDVGPGSTVTIESVEPGLQVTVLELSVEQASR